MRDLVALSALPAVWAGYQPRQVAEGLADVLLKTLRLDLVYLRLRGQTAGQEIEVFCTAGPPTTSEQLQDLSKALAPWLEGARSNSTPSIPNPVGRGTVHLVIDPIGCDGNDGLLIAGSQQTGFPTEEDCLLLRVGANQAAAAIQRQRAEEALVQERYLLHSLMDNLPDNIYFKDAASRFVRINKALTTYFGLSDPAQAIGKTDFDFFTEEHARQAYADEREIMRTGQPVVGKEEKEVWLDGRVRWVSTTKMPFRDSDGQIIGTFGVARDITNVKLGEEALRESERRFRTFVDHATDAFFLQDDRGVILD